jgi:hypothetical protein
MAIPLIGIAESAKPRHSDPKTCGFLVARVEADIKKHMEMVLRDWELYRARRNSGSSS